MKKENKIKRRKADNRHTRRCNCSRIVAMIASHSIVTNLRLFRKYYRPRRRSAKPIELILEETQSGKTKIQ